MSLLGVTSICTLKFSGRGSYSEQEAIKIIRTYLYGEKLHSYGRTVKVDGQLQHPISPFCPYALNPIRLELLASYIAMCKATNVLIPRQLSEAF